MGQQIGRMQSEFRFDSEKFREDMARVTEALQRIGAAFRSAGEVMGKAWMKFVADLYKSEVGRLPGSQRTARLRKKRQDVLLRWMEKRLAD